MFFFYICLAINASITFSASILTNFYLKNLIFPLFLLYLTLLKKLETSDASELSKLKAKSKMPEFTKSNSLIKREREKSIEGLETV